MTKVHVTQNDIDQGYRCKSRDCPIAIAAGRVFGTEVAIGGTGTVYVGEEMFEATRAVQYAIDIYDESGVMFPLVLAFEGGKVDLIEWG